MTFSRYKSVRRVLGTALILVGLSFALSPKIQAQESAAIQEATDCEIKPLYWTEQAQILREKGPSVRWCGDDEDAILETQKKNVWQSLKHLI